MAIGGFFRTPIRLDEESVAQYWSCLAWGEVTRNSVEKCMGRRPFCDFALRLKRGVFINVKVYKDSPIYELAKAVEEGDILLAVGTYSERPYIVRRDTKYTAAGTEKVYREFAATVLLPLSMLSDLFNNLYGVRDAAPDPMLSAEPVKKDRRPPRLKTRDTSFDDETDFGDFPDADEDDERNDAIYPEQEAPRRWD